MSAPSSLFGNPSYGLVRNLPGLGYADAIPAVREALASEGFGVLTEIDVAATLKKKLGAEFRPYVILGACNPPLAHQALEFEPAIGLLLPCNVVVAAEDDGSATVAFVDPVSQFSVVEREGLAPVAEQVKAKLLRALDRLPG